MDLMKIETEENLTMVAIPTIVKCAVVEVLLNVIKKKIRTKQYDGVISLLKKLSILFLEMKNMNVTRCEWQRTAVKNKLHHIETYIRRIKLNSNVIEAISYSHQSIEYNLLGRTLFFIESGTTR